MQPRSVVELDLQPALIIHYVYPGCRFTLPRAKLSCAYSAHGAKFGNEQLKIINEQLEIKNNEQYIINNVQ